MYNFVLFTIGMNKGTPMQKTAQKMDIWDKAREKTNIGGLAAEDWFDPEFKKIMNDLRKKDDLIRTVISGKSIGKHPTDGISCQDLLKSARSNFNKHEYMRSVADLGRFHKKFHDAVKVLEEFSIDLNAVHRRFLFDEVSPGSPGYNEEYAKYLLDLKTRFAEPIKASIQYSFVKEAGIVGGIMDFFKNIGSKRGRALMAWEKRYPGKIKELKKNLTRLLEQSDNLLKQTIFYLKTMATARAKRQVDDYKQAGDKILSYYKIYDDIFRAFYKEHLKTLMDAQEFVAKVVPVENSFELDKTDISKPTEALSSEEAVSGPSYTSSPVDVTPTSEELIGGSPNIVVPPEGTTEMSLFQAPSAPSGFIGAPRGLVRPQSTKPAPKLPIPQTAPSVAPAPAPAPAPTPPIVRTPVLTQDQGARLMEQIIKNRPLAPPGRKSHIRFMESLESLSNESPIILAKIIMKYANSIEKSDPLFHKQLVNIVKSIKV